MSSRQDLLCGRLTLTERRLIASRFLPPPSQRRSEILPAVIDRYRYGTGQRPLLPYEPHLCMDLTSSGESSSGFISQDSTMERCKTGTCSQVGLHGVAELGGTYGDRGDGCEETLRR